MPNVNMRFMDYARREKPAFKWSPAHEAVADAIDGFLDGTTQRLIVNMPPRWSKSTMAAELLPGLVAERFPKADLAYATHSTELADAYSRMAREKLAASDVREARPMAGNRLSDYVLAGGGKHRFRYVGSGRQGWGTDFLVVDDPHYWLDVLDDNKLAYECTRAWFATFRHCLKPDSSALVMMTRSSPIDLTGALQAEGGWKTVTVPALEKDGSTFPEFLSTEALELTKECMTPDAWQAQYMQDPR